MDLSRFAAFHFLHPAWLLSLLALLPAAAWAMRRQAQSGAWSSVIDSELLDALRLEKAARGGTPWLPIAAAWTLAAVALAGPAWQRVQSAAFRAPADWLVVLDLSPSMAAADLPPDRATRARYAIDDLLAAAHDARVGLIAFAGEAHTVVPLTTDVETVRALVKPLSPSLMPESGDNLGPALDRAAALLRQAASRHGKVIVLSDGFSDPSRALLAAQHLRQQGAVVEMVGVGTAAGAPEVDAKGSFVHDNEGRSVLSKLPVEQLQSVATAGGGRYWPLDRLPALIAQLASGGSAPFEGDSIDAGRQVSSWRNEGYWLIPPILLLASLLARRGWL